MGIITTINIYVRFVGNLLFFLMLGGTLYLFFTSLSNPFIDLHGTNISSTETYWFIDPTDPAHKRHISPPLAAAVKGQQFPVGRTLFLDRTVHAAIYKEIDCPDGQTYPVADSGNGTRVLQQGLQERLASSVMVTGPGSPPAGQICQYKVWFVVQRNPFVPPLIVPLKIVQIKIFPPDAKIKPGTSVSP